MTTIVILAAGQGTRMKTTLPKVLHELGGKAIVHHVIDTASHLNPNQIIVVLAPNMDADAIKGGRNIDIAIQNKALGTGDAVKAAMTHIKNPSDDVLILCADTPLVEEQALQQLLNSPRHHPSENPEIWLLAMELDNPHHYGRLRTFKNEVEAIVEYKDATPEERSIKLCNSAIYLIPGEVLQRTLSLLEPKNIAGEYYLTDIVTHARSLHVKTRYLKAQDSYVLHGINTLSELARAELYFQDRLRERFMLAGVKMVDPSTVYLSHDTIIGHDTVIYPNVFIGPQVVIETNVTLYPGCYLQKSHIGKGAKVGPYAHLRDNTILDSLVEIGNFVECKNSHFQAKSKAKHLSYMGDASVGEMANVGAGTITCNYNGYIKSKTIIEQGAFVGSNTSLVAPVKIGQNAIVGAGSTITRNVPAGALGLERSEQIIKDGWAQRFRETQQNNKIKLSKE